MKRTKKFSILRLALCFCFAFCILLSAFCICSAAEAPGAMIAGTQINLGGDISMKFYVIPAEGVTTDKVTLKINFLGVNTELKHPERVTLDGQMYYLFTFKGILPHCLGDTITAQLVVDGKAGTAESYTVADNLVETYPNCDAVTKQLIMDVLDYGSAAQTQTGYNTGTLVRDKLVTEDADNDVAVPNDISAVTSGTDTTCKLETVTVNFSSTNTLKFKLSPSTLAGVKINGEDPANYYISGEYLIVETKPIAPTDFNEIYTVTFGEGNSVGYSINAYCSAIVNGSAGDNMKALATSVYNYGLSAEKYQHVKTGEHTNTTYTASGASITATCSTCGELGTITLKAPENCVYDGLRKSVTLESTVPGVDTSTIEISYTGDRVNVTTDGFTASIKLGGATASLNVKITESTQPTVTAPTAIKDLTYDGSPHALVSAGTTSSGTMQYKLGNGAWSADIPEADSAGDYTVWFKVVGDDGKDLTEAKAITARIAPITYDASQIIITLSGTTFTYTGEAIKPTVSNVQVDGKALGTNEYEVTYANNVNASDAAVVIVTLKGNYSGKATATFTISAGSSIPGDFDGEWVE